MRYRLQKYKKSMRQSYKSIKISTFAPENLDSIHNVEEFGCLQPHKKMLKLQILIQQRVIRDNLAACGSPHQRTTIR